MLHLGAHDVSAAEVGSRLSVGSGTGRAAAVSLDDRPGAETVLRAAEERPRQPCQRRGDTDMDEKRAEQVARDMGKIGGRAIAGAAKLVFRPLIKKKK
ncbi:hypothetical protein GCM10010191_10370 [Actinomadura vinacea]|uniref:Uncharacterized protein n=1 Tax=Actinomadura vinacea TaxID=115336 RepID=A0ABN3IHL1_9ACTN